MQTLANDSDLLPGSANRKETSEDKAASEMLMVPTGLLHLPGDEARSLKEWEPAQGGKVRVDRELFFLPVLLAIF